MNKQDLIKATYERTAGTLPDATLHVEAVLQAIRAGLKEDGEVYLTGIGRLVTQMTKDREGRNPKTGETIDIKAKRVARLKTTATFGAYLNDQGE